MDSLGCCGGIVRSVANLATFSLFSASFQTPLATVFSKKRLIWQTFAGVIGDL